MSTVSAMTRSDYRELGFIEDEIEKFFSSNGELEENLTQEEPKEEANEAHQEEAIEKIEDDNKELESKQEEIENNHTKAMYQERQRRKEAEARLHQTESKIRELEEAFNKKIEAMALEREKLMKSDSAEKAPKYEEDPLEALRYKTEQLDKRLSEKDQKEQRLTAEQEKRLKESQSLDQFRTLVKSKVEDFVTETPDYFDAYNFVMEKKLKEYQVAGYTTEAAKKLLEQDEYSIAIQALQSEENPAKRVYELAKYHGYQNMEKKGPKETAEVEKFEKLAKGVARSNNRLPPRGEPELGEFSIEQFENLRAGSRDFEKLWNKIHGVE